MRNSISMWGDRTRERELARALKRERAQVLKREWEQTRVLQRELVQAQVLQRDPARVRVLEQRLKQMRTREERIRERFSKRYLELEQSCVQARNASAAKKNAIITLLSYILCERERIEWTGHFDEARERWQGQGLSPWIIRYKTSCIVLSFLWARVRCLVDDCIFARYWEKS